MGACHSSYFIPMATAVKGTEESAAKKTRWVTRVVTRGSCGIRFQRAYGTNDWNLDDEDFEVQAGTNDTRRFKGGADVAQRAVVSYPIFVRFTQLLLHCHCNNE